MQPNEDPNDTPEVSVLLVNWNTREMTLECLRSLYRETRDVRFETIVLDNASSDGSVEAIAAEFPQVRLLAERDNLGFARATNLQVGLARAPLVLLLNTDTLVTDRAVGDERVGVEEQDERRAREPDLEVGGAREAEVVALGEQADLRELGGDRLHRAVAGGVVEHDRLEPDVARLAVE